MDIALREKLEGDEKKGRMARYEPGVILDHSKETELDRQLREKLSGDPELSDDKLRRIFQKAESDRTRKHIDKYKSNAFTLEYTEDKGVMNITLNEDHFQDLSEEEMTQVSSKFAGQIALLIREEGT